MAREEELLSEETMETPRKKPTLGENSERGTAIMLEAMNQLADQLRDVRNVWVS